MEIEFRAKDAENGRWHYGYYVMHEKVTPCVFSCERDFKENEEHYIIYDGFSDWNLPKPWYRADVDKNTLGQYINIRDSEKKKIYVGDVLKDNNGRLWVVFDAPGGFRVCREEDYINMKSGSFEIQHGLSEPQNASWTSQLKIVGNIHDNPELLALMEERV